MNNFYKSGLGTRLILEDNYPEEIHRYLIAELKLLGTIISDYKVITEVGCMHGRYTDYVLEHGCNYLGVDVVESYIKEGKRLAKQKSYNRSRCRFKCIDARHIHKEIFLKEMFGMHRSDNLIFYPFNCIGNMMGIGDAIDSLIKLNSPFLICTYKTDNESTRVRFDYYYRCEYARLTCVRQDSGVLFTSNDGLNTIALDQNWLINAFMERGVTVYPIPLSKIGVAYTNSRTIVQRQKEAQR